MGPGSGTGPAAPLVPAADGQARQQSAPTGPDMLTHDALGAVAVLFQDQLQDEVVLTVGLDGATRLAQRGVHQPHRPELVATLTSVSSVCQRTSEERISVLDRLRTAKADFTASAAASLKRWYDGTDVAYAWVARTEATLLANDVDSFLGCYRVFATADAELGPDLGAIVVPALAVTGENDPGSTPEMARRLAAVLPDCRAVVVPEARHMLPVERPQALVGSLTTFLGECAHV